MLPKKPPSNTLKLFQIAGYTGIFVSSSILLMKWLRDKKVRQTEFYTRTCEQVLSNRPLVQYLGEPIYFGNVDFSDERNRRSETEAQIVIPVKGSKENGTVIMTAVPPPSKLDTKKDEDIDVYSYNTEKSSSIAGWLAHKLEVHVKGVEDKVILVPIPDSLPICSKT